MHDLAGVEAGPGIKRRLDLLEGAQDLRAEHRPVKFRPHDAVAMLAGMRPLVLAHHPERRLGDLAHGAHILLQLEVEDRPYMQTSFRGMRIPRAVGAVAPEHLRQPVGIFGQMIERHRAILDEGDGFALVLHRHHDVEARLAQFPDIGGQRHVADLDHATFKGAALAEAIAEIGHGIGKAAHVRVVLGRGVGKLDQQHRRGIAAHELLQRAGIDRDRAGQIDHRPVDQFDRGGTKRHQRFRRLHRGAEAGEMADAKDTGA